MNLLALSAASGVCNGSTTRGHQTPDDDERDGHRNVGWIQIPNATVILRRLHRMLNWNRIFSLVQAHI